ncbi:hypothetical protein TNCT_424821 [Trichonephila clavata]|uniref:Uncharacterized protein n=1 Tax=Trichonephila clavata TaxID=2740835 RepID=A0A8X6G8Z3_TRICU|nr:hypothetical protein TNCT_424821 [Trichonephila clavata]
MKLPDYLYIKHEILMHNFHTIVVKTNATKFDSFLRETCVAIELTGQIGQIARSFVSMRSDRCNHSVLLQGLDYPISHLER